jgi:hypothetical protein
MTWLKKAGRITEDWAQRNVIDPLRASGVQASLAGSVRDRGSSDNDLDIEVIYDGASDQYQIYFQAMESLGWTIVHGFRGGPDAQKKPDPRGEVSGDKWVLMDTKVGDVELDVFLWTTEGTPAPNSEEL